MNLTDAIRKLRNDGFIPESKHYDIEVAARLDELTGHTKAVEACRAVTEDTMLFDNESREYHESAAIQWLCYLCGMGDEHTDGCPVRLCAAAVADADKE